MTDVREQAKLLVKSGISSVVILSNRLGLDEDSTRTLLQEMVSAGEILGYLSGDGTRFFSTEVKKSAAPALPADEEPPAFLRFNTTPGRILATLGLIIIIASYLSLTLNSSVEIQNISAGALFLGILVMCGGCYWISMRKTPP